MGQERKSSARQVVKNLIKDDGWGGLYRGFGPRFFSMSAWGTSMILAYEYLSKDISIFYYHFDMSVACNFIWSPNINYGV